MYRAGTARAEAWKRRNHAVSVRITDRADLALGVLAATLNDSYRGAETRADGLDGGHGTQGSGSKGSGSKVAGF